MKKLTIDNPFFDMMGRFGGIILVNLLFIFCSLPVVTAGAALSAMYSVFRKMEQGTEGRAARTYLRCFWERLRPCTPVWLLMLAAGLLLTFDVVFLGHIGMRGIWKFVGAGTGCLFLIWEMLYAWLFPVLADDEEKGGEALKKAARLSVLHLPGTLLMAVLNNILLICLALGIYYVMVALPLYLVFGFGMTAYVNTKVAAECTKRTGTAD